MTPTGLITDVLFPAQLVVLCSYDNFLKRSSRKVEGQNEPLLLIYAKNLHWTHKMFHISYK